MIVSVSSIFRSNTTLYILVIVVFLISCNDDREKAVDRKISTIFEMMPSSHSNVDFANQLKNSQYLNIVEYLYYYNGGGVAVGDLDNDNLDDIILTGNEVSDRVYFNKGDFTFEDVTVSAGFDTTATWSTGVTIDDINNDGWNDIYICKVGVFTDPQIHNQLYINNQDGTFTEVAKDYGLAFSGFSTQSSFFDYDNDGDLDMYLLNHSIHSTRSYGTVKKRSVKDSLSGDLLFENLGTAAGFKFKDVTEQAGILSSALGYGLAVATMDINMDGLTDIYVGNDFHENDYLYINNGDKTFSEDHSSAFTNTTQFSMGVDIADLNNDQLPDIFTTDMMPQDGSVLLKSGGADTDKIKSIKGDLGFSSQQARNHLQLQRQDHMFTDIALMTETFASDWSWAPLIQDFDKDGTPEIVVTNGIRKRPNDLDYINYLNQYDGNDQDGDLWKRTQSLINNMPEQPLRNILFDPSEDGVNAAMSMEYITPPTYSNGAAYSDLDQDGDLDLVINNLDEKAHILKNNTSRGNYVTIQLRSEKGSAKGSKVFLYAGGQVMMKEYQTTRGYQSASSHDIFFGLGSATSVDSVIVQWQQGGQSILYNVQINQVQIIDDNTKSEEKKIDVQKGGNDALVLPYRHRENTYEDYNIEKLIPEAISREGPAIVQGDFNKDGYDDIYIGGARHQEPALYMGSKSGTYKPKDIPDFKKDGKYEDIDAALIDFNKDGHQDIYVVSGGGDALELDKLLEDRLYINDGNANFRRYPLSFPHSNGGTVSIADVNQDGFDDIFVGSRSLPKGYGLSPYSFLLKNKNGLTVDILEKERWGMVTDSEFVDLNNDGHQDLILCGDWMPITILINNGNGQFTNETSSFGMESTSGLWNSIQSIDLNQDGTLDIIAGNAGQNFLWKASKDHPVKMYIGDFDNNGDTDPIIFHHYFGESVPFATLDQLTSQIPSIKKDFTDYQSFGEVRNLDDLLGKNYVTSLLDEKSIHELRSMIFIMQDGKYSGYPLPAAAQRSTIQDFAIGVNGEVIYIANHKDYHATLGANLGNPGGVLSQWSDEYHSFEEHQDLNLPHHLNTRNIVPIGDDQYLITSNNDYIFIVNRKND